MLILRRLLARIFNIFDKSVDTYRELFSEREDLRILEVAYGFGVNTFNIIRSIESLKNVILVSLDIDPRALFSGSRVYRAYLERGLLELVVADARKLPFRDKSFNIVISHTTLHHVRELEKSLEEMIRVLETSGRIVVIDLVPSKIYDPIPEHQRNILSKTLETVTRIFSEKTRIISINTSRLFYQIIAEKN